jgi:hypothetical protein
MRVSIGSEKVNAVSETDVFDRSGIGSVITVKIKARIPTIEAMTPNLFQRVSRLNLWNGVIFTP